VPSVNNKIAENEIVNVTRQVEWTVKPPPTIDYRLITID